MVQESWLHLSSRLKKSYRSVVSSTRQQYIMVRGADGPASLVSSACKGLNVALIEVCMVTANIMFFLHKDMHAKDLSYLFLK